MKRIFWMVPVAIALCAAPFAISGAMASTRERKAAQNVDTLGVDAIAADAPSNPSASVGRATANFGNARYDRAETAWGKLVADALRSSSKADVALVNAAVLERGTLQAGNVSRDDVAALFSFGDDDIATVEITGAQLRMAMERAVSVSPTGSPAWLHISGATVVFDSGLKSGSRVTKLQIGGRDVQNSDSLRIVMPIGLAEGGSGYYKIWNKIAVTDLGTTLTQTVVDYIRARREISPDTNARIVGN